MKRLVLSVMCLAVLIFVVTAGAKAAPGQSNSGPMVTARSGGKGPGADRCYWKRVCRPCRRMCRPRGPCRLGVCRIKCVSSIQVGSGGRCNWGDYCAIRVPVDCRCFRRGDGKCFKFCNYRNKRVRCRRKELFGPLLCIDSIPDCRCVPHKFCPPPDCRQYCPRPRCVRMRVCR